MRGGTPKPCCNRNDATAGQLFMTFLRLDRLDENVLRWWPVHFVDAYAGDSHRTGP